MSTTIPLVLRGTVESRGDANPLLQEPGDYVLVRRGQLRLALLSCPDGCGETVVVNLDARAGKAWRFYSTRRGASLYPSVWRDTGCQSHFIVWNDRILLFGSNDLESTSEVDEALARRVVGALAGRVDVDFRDLADELVEVPWEVLETCNGLVDRRLVRKGSARGTFSASR